jgi:hypothetical protein
MALMVLKTEQVTNLNDASFLKDRIKRSYLQWYQLKLKKLRKSFLINKWDISPLKMPIDGAERRVFSFPELRSIQLLIETVSTL